MYVYVNTIHVCNYTYVDKQTKNKRINWVNKEIKPKTKKMQMDSLNNLKKTQIDP